MEAKNIKKLKTKISALRILGAICFGFLFGMITRSIINYSIPSVLGRIINIPFAEAYNIYSSAVFVNLLIGSIIIFLSAAIAGFLAKRSGILVGLITNSAPIIFLFLALASAILLGANPLAVFSSVAFYQFLFMVLASVFGGLFGEHFYSEERNLDSHSDGLTIFGVHLWHYIWIVPIIYYPFVSATVALIYSWIFTFSTELYFINHFNLWINVAWWFYFFLNPIIIFIAALLLVYSFIRVWKIMQFRQKMYAGSERVWAILMYGLLVPIFVRLVVNFSGKATYNMYKPIVNDWKVSAAYILFIPAVGVFLSFTWWVKNKIVTIGKKQVK